MAHSRSRLPHNEIAPHETVSPASCHGLLSHMYNYETLSSMVEDGYSVIAWLSVA